MSDEYSDEERRPSPRNFNNLSKKKEDRVSVPGAIVSGIFNGLLMVLILTVPSLGLPFITSAFSSVMVPMLVGTGASLISTFMQLGYSTYRIRKFSKALESGGSALGLWSLWKFYPLDFSSLVPPQVAIDTWLPIVFGVFAIFSGISAVVNLVKGIRGPSEKKKKQLEQDEERLDD